MTFVALLWVACTLVQFHPSVHTWKSRPELDYENLGPWVNFVSFFCMLYLVIGTLL